MGEDSAQTRRAQTRARGILTQAIDLWWGRGLAYQAPALGFYLIVSLAPLALGLTALVGLLGGDALEPARVSEEIAETFPAAIQDDIISLTRAFKNQSPMLVVVSIVAMLWTSSAALGVIERSMTAVGETPGFGIIWGRIRLILLGAYFALLVIGATFMATVAGGLVDLSALMLFLFNLTGMTLICALIYYFAPSARPRLSSALLGALPAALTLQLTPYLVGRYFELGASLSPASLFFSIGVVVASCYLIATGLVLGAGLAARRG